MMSMENVHVEEIWNKQLNLQKKTQLQHTDFPVLVVYLGKQYSIHYFWVFLFCFGLVSVSSQRSILLKMAKAFVNAFSLN